MPVTFPISTGDLLEIVLPYTLNGQTMMNVLHYMAEGSVASTGGKQAVDDLVAVLEGAGGIREKIAAMQSQDVLHQRVTAQIIWPTRRIRLRYDSPALQGAKIDTKLPQNVSVALTKKGALATRNNIGRMSIGGITAAADLDGFVPPPTIDLLEALGELVDDTVNVGGVTWTPVIYNRTLPAQSVPIVTTQPEETVRTQRTRTVGRGI